LNKWAFIRTIRKRRRYVEQDFCQKKAVESQAAIKLLAVEEKQLDF